MSEEVSPFRTEKSHAAFVWAHRGASALAPENSLQAFLLAGELGADGVELDIRLTSDGVPAVVHDRALWSDGVQLYCRPAPTRARSLSRLLVAQCRWADLRQLRVVHSNGASAAIERLEAVLEVLPSRLWVDIELKAGRDHDPRMVAVVKGCIVRRPERVLASSFDHLVLRDLARLDPSLPLLAICHARLIDPFEALRMIPTTMICVDRPFLELSDVLRWNEEGLEVSVGALENAQDLGEVLAWPLSTIFLDDPTLARVPPRSPPPGEG